MAWTVLPLALQATAMMVDELYFHRRRGLPRWERIGHPIDTLSVLVCYGFALSTRASASALWIYAGLSAMSSLLITKDEFVHARACPPAELWLHAVLFVLHPVVLATVAWLWFSNARALLFGQTLLTSIFFLYQVSYWNLRWKPDSDAR